MTTFGKETKYFAVEKGRICQFECCTKWLCRNKKLYTLHTHTYCTQQRTTNNTVVSKSVFYVNTCMCVVQITNEYYDKRTFIQWFIKFVQQMKSSLTNRKCYNSQWCVDLCAFKILIEIYIYILSVPIPIPSGVFAYEFEKPMLCVICKHINSNLQ